MDKIRLTTEEKQGLQSGQLLSAVGNLFFLIEETDPIRKQMVMRKMMELHNRESGTTIISFCQWLDNHSIAFTARCRYIKKIGVVQNVMYYLEYQCVRKRINQMLGWRCCR